MEGTSQQSQPKANTHALNLPYHRRPSPFAYAAPSPAPPSTPMPITPNVRQSPPPPLPPPRQVEELGQGQNPAWNHQKEDSNTPTPVVKSGSSLLGGQQGKQGKLYTGPERSIDFGRQTRMEDSPSSNQDTKTDASEQSQDRVPDLQALLEYNKLQGEREMGQRSLERSSQMYDKHLLSRIGGPHTPPRLVGGIPTIAGPEETTSRPQAQFKKLNGQVNSLSMPERRHSSMEMPQARWTTGTSPGVSSLRSPVSEQEIDQAQFRQNLLVRSHRESYDQSAMFGEQEYQQPEDPAMQELKFEERDSLAADGDDQDAKTGQKRRANSPPSDSVLDPRLPGGNTESWARRAIQMNNANRSPQMQRVQISPGSLSSNASAGPRNSSLASSYGISNPSTSTSYGSERVSPNNYLAHEMQRQGQIQMPPSHLSHMMPQSSLSQLQQPLAAPPIPHRRTTNSGLPRAPGLWICDCCPKKPKKFESEEELRIHEMEKQYICQYCHNRFKNKNEAERHQNSLHLRRHSWSCAALTSFEAAFHPTPATAINAASPSQYNLNPNYPPPAQSDTCGYCGVEFVNPPEWEVRIEHLNRLHKFGECNQSKKFFRADHFRQHLKHSHAGTSGKWTNMLENACMRDEPPPQPIHPMAMGMNMGMPQAPLANMMPGQQHYAHLAPGRLSDLRDDYPREDVPHEN